MTTTKGLQLAAVGDLDNEKRLRILGVIDKLRELGVGENLVVVGDQSSGKSSLLEGLTGLSFPIASDLCTRFATQIVLRRAPANEASVRIMIIPGPDAQGDEETLDSLLGFEQVLPVADFDSDRFQKIFDEATCMGVPGPSTKDLEDLEKRFSDDILRIELSGPDHHHLSVVDVPGLFHNPTKCQTEEDRTIIRKLIEDYITDKRTIILAVMDARNNLANQEVFSMARAADPAGTRTVGIITKCDALQAGDEQGVLRIAKNEVERLTHGWFTVKNRSTQEIVDGVTIDERHKREKHFFATITPWTELKRERTGIYALKAFLGGLLYSHICNEFPEVVKDIEQLSSSTLEELELLGPSRQTNADQRRFLMRLANAYQQDVINALSGNYAPELDGDDPLKLRMHIRKLSDEFGIVMAQLGHAKMFQTVEGGIDQEFYRSHGESEDILEWIRRLYQESRGAELPGTVNPRVPENTLRQQSGPWKNIATVHIDTVSEVVRKFNDAVFISRISDDELRRKLTAKLSRGHKATHNNANQQLFTILNDERGGILQTVNHYFADTLSAIREKRVLARLKAAGFENGSRVDLASMVKGIHLSNEDQAVNDIYDTLKAYYKVALKRFTDNVVLQITERLMLGPGGPVKILSPEMIGDLQDSELADLAGENFSTSGMRNELTNKYERLQKALDIAKQAFV
ncbi:P-loop containing nucleoside triphosphate hydrolase protein [Clohesyomyces aquaticus]|uniref:p-loop containing nucleoside triphosphate hydrolase protein n=1 Tax=Clohesyomyces aquaticus TaxID=1231657 RepID=A0A1Y2AAL0_9PLEO|nr:P-loop containing nucleoside triphosphate hydrolase protein [Clohesyomyces aquaticus]